MKQACTGDARAGNILMVVVIFLGLAVFTVISIFVATGNYTRINFQAYERERAFQLADAGLRATILELNSGRGGVLNAAQSNAFFTQTNQFRASNWGFFTAVSNVSSTLRRVVSTGTYGGGRVTVAADVRQGTQARSIHSLYAHAIYAGNSSGSTNYVLQIGGTGTGADFVIGDVYSGYDLAVSGDARLRYPESFIDEDGNGLFDDGEVRTDAGLPTHFSNAVSAVDFAAYTSSVSRASLYPNGRRDDGEAFIDTIGNGVFDPGEAFVDLDGDGQFGFGEPFDDGDDDGEFDLGEGFVDHGNGRWDAGEAFEDLNGNGQWDDAIPGGWETIIVKRKPKQVWRPAVPAEPFEDLGNGQYDVGEEFIDRNGVYDPGETFFDDRNGRHDYGAQAVGAVSGMTTPGVGQVAATGSDPLIDPPDLSKMYYGTSKSVTTPVDASSDWGHDVDVAAAPFNSSGKVMNQSDPRHIFVKNPSNRTYTKIPGKDDFFIEDPTDPSYGNSSQFLTVTESGNNKVYYVDGNVYLHNPNTYDFKFREPGVRITIVAKGNITISDEFWYNGGTANPQDSLALIAMKDSAVANSGNIYLGDAQFGTGGDVHAMLYAENNFVDNNLNQTGQSYLSVFGNMTAGNHVSINRSGPNRTRLDVTLDERIVDRINLPPGLPQAVSGQRSISVTGSWEIVQGTWQTSTPMR